MSDQNVKANNRLTKISDFLTGNKTATTIPWDPDCTKFPRRKDVPRRDDAPMGAYVYGEIIKKKMLTCRSAWVWGKDDYVRHSSGTDCRLLIKHR
jgi:hypothetical protein